MRGKHNKTQSEILELSQELLAGARPEQSRKGMWRYRSAVMWPAVTPNFENGYVMSLASRKMIGVALLSRLTVGLNNGRDIQKGFNLDPKTGRITDVTLLTSIELPRELPDVTALEDPAHKILQAEPVEDDYQTVLTELRSGLDYQLRHNG